MIKKDLSNFIFSEKIFCLKIETFKRYLFLSLVSFKFFSQDFVKVYKKIAVISVSQVSSSLNLLSSEK
jgi:hypothetical protein